MSERQGVAITIRGREFRIRSQEDPEALQRIARSVDETMTRVEARTGTVDTLDVALLTALNLARELIEVRDEASVSSIDPGRLVAMIELAESAVAPENR